MLPSENDAWEPNPPLFFCKYRFSAQATNWTQRSQPAAGKKRGLISITPVKELHCRENILTSEREHKSKYKTNSRFSLMSGRILVFHSMPFCQCFTWKAKAEAADLCFQLCPSCMTQCSNCEAILSWLWKHQIKSLRTWKCVCQGIPAGEDLGSSRYTQYKIY